MEAASTSETSINFYQTTRRYNPEDSHLHTHRRENLKSYRELGGLKPVLEAVEKTTIPTVTRNPVVNPGRLRYYGSYHGVSSAGSEDSEFKLI
jgi:hypothetical protein